MFKFISLVISVVLFSCNSSNSNVDFKKINFSKELIADLKTNKKSYFVNTTATWCLTCKAFEKAYLKNEKVYNLFLENKIQFIEADMTRENEEIANFINSFNRSGIPLYVLSINGKDHLLPEGAPNIEMIEKIIEEEKNETVKR